MRVCIVAAKYNEQFADALVDNTVAELSELMPQTRVDIIRVPGAFEIPVTIANLEARDVMIRLMGDFAIIHARTSYQTADGGEGNGRYTDVWAKRDGQWLAVSAHVSR